MLAGVIEDVLRCRSGPIRVPELAFSAGFSRFHLARLFHHTTEETLEAFLRRIRLERAAYMLLNSDQSILEISLDCGYRSPESFSRGFRREFGSLPSEFRKLSGSWKIPASSDLHWNADWVVAERPSLSLQERLVSMPARHACVHRAVGNYSRLEEAWTRFGEDLAAYLPSRATYVTLYLDNMWTHPVAGTMRADIGWLCTPAATPPPGMRKIVIPAGCYATTRFVERTERNDAWSFMSGHYATKDRYHGRVAYDEYAAWPLPFSKVRTRILIGQR